MGRISEEGFMQMACELSTPENRFDYCKVAEKLTLSPEELDDMGRRLEAAGRIHCPFGPEWVIIGDDIERAAEARKRRIK